MIQIGVLTHEVLLLGIVLMIFSTSLTLTSLTLSDFFFYQLFTFKIQFLLLRYIDFSEIISLYLKAF